ncbi:MAG: hypothetical protein VB064_12375 [Oscillospiraceae bacterium]|nr:hypothetical protein [Oscillospiraceae bacterium]
MKVSFEGIGESVVTFFNSATGSATAGAPVLISANGEVSACADGDRFFGCALACDTDIAAIQTAGYIELAYSGTNPAVGFVRLAANGSGGVKASEDGGEFLVVNVDTANKTLGLML